MFNGINIIFFPLALYKKLLQLFHIYAGLYQLKSFVGLTYTNVCCSKKKVTTDSHQRQFQAEMVIQYVTEPSFPKISPLQFPELKA